MSIETVLKYSVRDDTSFVIDPENAEIIEERDADAKSAGMDLKQMSVRDNNLSLYAMEYNKCRESIPIDDLDSGDSPTIPIIN